MTIREYMEVGYIRSNCLNKTVGLLKGTTVTALKIQRSQQEKGKRDSPYPWISYHIAGIGNFVLDWDLWFNKTSFDNVIKILSEFKMKYKLSDFVVEKITIGIRDQRLVDMINDNQKTKKSVSAEQVFVTFRNTPLAYTTLMLDGQSDLIQKINLNAIVNLKFKKGVLDLKSVSIMDGSKMTYYESMLNSSEFIEQVLHNLDTADWYNLPEIKSIPTHPSPCAIRTYEMKEGKKWAFLKDRDVK